MEKIIVSACLLGSNCKYNGGNNYNEELVEFLRGKEIIEICPESMGGLETPRVPSEIENGKTAEDVLNGEGLVISKLGVDVTAEFVLGAMKSLEIAKENNIELAILKESSPSCGSRFVYDGNFEGTKIEGRGLTAELFTQYGIRVVSEESIDISTFTNDTTMW